MKKLFLLGISTLLLFSCSRESSSEEFLNVKNFTGPVIQKCEGYNIYENKQYDCGWKRGYDDWVYHYNSVVQGENLPQCYEIRMDIRNDGTPFLVWVTVDNSPAIIQKTQNLYYSYYDNLANNSSNSDFDHGKFDGYSAGRGQVPYAANGDPGDCN